MTQNRFAGIDLAKTIAIYFVLVLHATNCDVSARFDDLTLDWAYSFIRCGSSTCIDIFALATGYLCVHSHYRYSRIVGLWLTTVFWGITVLLACDFALGFNVPVIAYAKAVLPVLSGQYWFFTSYFMLFLFIPALNKVILNLGRREYIRILVVIGVFICVYSCATGDLFSMKNGFSFPWLCCVYIIGGYIRRFGECHWPPYRCFLTAFALVFLATFRHFVSIFVGHRIPGDRFGLNWYYLSPLILGASVMIFIGCRNLRIGARLSKALRLTAIATFGVYVIHQQPFLWKNAIAVVLQRLVMQSAAAFILHVFVASLVAMCCLLMLEWFRIGLFRVCGIDRLLSKVDDLLPS